MVLMKRRPCGMIHLIGVQYSTERARVEVGFADQRLRELCERERLARRAFGAAAAKKLRRRLADLASASRLAEVVAGRPHPLRHDRKGSFSISLGEGLSLLLKPSGDDAPVDADGEIDWPNVSRVTITEVTDYHD